MITEDYVSYETAKLLKKSGFASNEISCINVFKGHTYKIQDTVIDADEDVTIPTIQMATKWLRKAYNLFIVIDRYYFVVDRISHIASGFKYSIEIKTINTVYTHNDYKSYEEACEVAIKYCLKNLI